MVMIRKPLSIRFFYSATASFSLVALFSALGCSSSGGGEGGSGGSGGSSNAGGGGSGDPSILVGTFQARLISPVPPSGGDPGVDGSTAVLGKVYDGETPQTIVWEEKSTASACKLSTPRVPFCNTPCGGSAACVENDQCQNYPIAHSAGNVTVTGLHTASGQSSFVMTPVNNNYQAPAGVSLPYPAFSEGEEIAFAAAGDYYSAFTVKSKGIAPLTLTAETYPIETGKDLVIEWTKPQQAGISKIHVKLDISHHGGTKGMIECDADDTGSLTVASSLVSELLALGIAGYPTIIVTRSATGSTTIAQGRVDAVVSHSVERPIEIAGLTSCTSDTDCPNGQTCQVDLTCK